MSRSSPSIARALHRIVFGVKRACRGRAGCHHTSGKVLPCNLPRLGHGPSPPPPTPTLHCQISIRRHCRRPIRHRRHRRATTANTPSQNPIPSPPPAAHPPSTTPANPAIGTSPTLKQAHCKTKKKIKQVKKDFIFHDATKNKKYCNCRYIKKKRHTHTTCLKQKTHTHTDRENKRQKSEQTIKHAQARNKKTHKKRAKHYRAHNARTAAPEKGKTKTKRKRKEY